MTFSTCESGEWVPAYDTATLVLVEAFIRKGRKVILLDELYDFLGCQTKAEKTSVRMAIRKLKHSKVLRKCKVKGVYEVE